MLKIERKSDGQTTIIWVIGRIQSEHLDELKAQMNDNSGRTILDLDEVTLVDADVVRFLSASEEAGIALVRCPLYVREWILRERARFGLQQDKSCVRCVCLAATSRDHQVITVETLTIQE